ncbi:glycosyltransferase family 2 protein [Thalassococcus sp. S3]|uniref:glycosyltransferase family 2 protein n=1 Tax=Thalassococcus sp. S3 TaxID=2017482 RepID=UPI0010246BEA|nr:glycosyltransferase family 2 protein [Thalassococcus sp. S3]QBF34270.1 hypothetical protein CFI11_24095 [Thalassococcus sp. S3]
MTQVTASAPTIRLAPVDFLTLEIVTPAAVEVHFAGQALSVLDDPDIADRFELPVPGWMWQAVPAGAPLVLDWHCPERDQRGQFSIWRGDVGARLGLLAQSPAAEYEAAALVGALEHVHAGGVTEDTLTPELRQWLSDAAALTGLGAIFPPPAPEAEPGDYRAITTFGGILRQGEARDPARLSMAFDAGLAELTGAQSSEVFLLAVTPAFCRADAMDVLLDRMRAHDLPVPQSDTVAEWAYIQVLAHRLAQQDWAGAHEVSAWLSETSQTWVSTPALGWALRQTVAPATWEMPGWIRSAILHNLLRFLEAVATRIPGLVACTEMVRMAAALVMVLDRFEEDLETRLSWSLLRLFGTVPEFWSGVQALERAGVTLRTELRAGAEAFALFCRALDQPGAPEARDEALADVALRDLRRLGVAHTEALRIEALGPYGSGRQRSATTSQVFLENDPGDAALLRGLAAPLAADLAPVPVDQLRQTMRWMHKDVAAVADARPVEHAMRQAWDLIRGGTLEGERGPAFWSALIHVAGAGAQFSGLAIAFATLADLLDRGRPAPSEALAEAIASTLIRMSKEHGDALLGSPFVGATAARLLQVADRAETGPAVGAIADRLRDLGLTAGTVKEPPASLRPAPALFDTLVVICSCEANLDTRIPALRKGWLAELKRFGIPYVIVVGGTETWLDGDVLRVAAPDDYAGLPEKMLAAIRWVRNTTDYAHLFKLDDDCHLDVEAYFLNPFWRRHTWYGRRLVKPDGMADRLWSQPGGIEKTPPARFDKLPRHGVYADGSTGYALHRWAMGAVLRVADSLEGQRMRAGAQAEDKLIGALLVQEGFYPENTEYHTLVLRKTVADGAVVPRWAAGFMANDTLRLTRVVHFDETLPATRIAAARRAPGLFPRRLWPATRKPLAGHGHAGLTLVTSEARLARLVQAPVAVVAVMRNEMFMLPHFLAHYRRLGVESFLVVDNLSEDGTLEYLADQPDVAVFSAETDFRDADQGTEWKTTLAAQLRPGLWTLVADADELAILPAGTDSLAQHVRTLGRETDAQRLLMLDLYPQGPLSDMTLASGDPFSEAPFADRSPFLANSIARGPFSNADTFTSALRHRLMPGNRPEAFVVQKVALFRHRPWMRFSTSLHYAAGVRLAEETLVFGHFKYTAEFDAKAHREVARGQYWNNAEEYRQYLTRGFGEGGLYDPAVSVPWSEALTDAI